MFYPDQFIHISKYLVFFGKNASALSCYTCDSAKNDKCVEYDYALKDKEFQTECVDPDDNSCFVIIKLFFFFLKLNYEKINL